MIASTYTKLRFVLLAVMLLWVKTYIVCKVVFDIDIKNNRQEFLLFISPVSSLLAVIGLALWAKGKWHARLVVAYSFFMSLILYANVLFYGFFDDFLTFPVLFQKANIVGLGSSIRELASGTTLVLFADVLILAAIAWKYADSESLSGAEKGVYYAAAFALFAGNVALAEIERPQLLVRSFDREMLVKHIGLFNYQVYDAMLQSRSSVQRAIADSSKLAEIENYTAAHHHKPNSRLFGIAKQKNVIVISMESMQSFVLNRTLNGKELTPFLNTFIKESYFFDEFYHQTGQGKTSDAEFIMENSLYPLDRGAVFFTHAWNDYIAIPEVLQEYGYYSAVFHANNKSFWNRDVMYPSLGYNKYVHGAYYSAPPEQSVGWGLKDKEFFEQSIAHFKSLPQPFYAKCITLTNHFPFELAQEDNMLGESPTGTLYRYLATVRYMDEAIGHFIKRLKEEGLYENTVLVLYGDHYGISENHHKAMAQYLNRTELTPFDHVQLQRVPLIIHIAGERGRIISRIGGQVDFKPTLLHLLGIHRKQDISFGEDLFVTPNRAFMVMRDGSFVTDEHVYTDNVCYDKKTQLPTDPSLCSSHAEQARTELRYSDKIIYGDLLRFFEGNRKKRTNHDTVMY